MRTAAAGVAGMVGATVLDPDRASATPRTGGGLGAIRLASLSHVNDPATTTLFPGDPPFSLETVATIPNDGFYMQYVRENEHTGTHWGAPGHFEEGGLLADQLDPQDLYLPAVKIDIRAKAAHNADYALTIADVRAWERRYGRIPSGAAVVLWTGWEAKWGTDAYANIGADGLIHQPGFGAEVAHWLVDTGRLATRGSLGTDTFGADLGIDETFEASTTLFHEHRISLENLNNLQALPFTGGFVLVGGPINKNGSGSTATIWCVTC